MPGQEVVFGFGAHSGVDEVPELLRMTQQADRDGLDIFSLSDHPYIGGRLDAYAAVGFVLGGTRRLVGFANVTSLPLRPAPTLARTVASLSALSGGRIVLGAGAGGLWDRISDMGVPRLSPGDAVDSFEEAITLVKMLCGGGPPVTYQGRHYRVNQIDPAPAPAPAVWTGSVGRKSLAATGWPTAGSPGTRRTGSARDTGLPRRLSTKRRQRRAVTHVRSALLSTFPARSLVVRWPPRVTATAAGSAVQPASGPRNWPVPCWSTVPRASCCSHPGEARPTSSPCRAGRRRSSRPYAR